MIEGVTSLPPIVVADLFGLPLHRRDRGEMRQQTGTHYRRRVRRAEASVGLGDTTGPAACGGGGGTGGPEDPLLAVPGGWEVRARV